MNNKWVQAGIALSKDPTLKVKCPSCNDDILNVFDQYIAGHNTYERIMSCNKCKSTNSIKMTYKK